MSTLSSYTPFESLLFFQSLATLDSRPTSFGPISELLKNNPFIRQDVTFDANRLAPQALENLYNTLIKEGLGSPDDKILENHQHGLDTGQQPFNPKKRKLASASEQNTASHTSVIPNLVSQLYARYKERATSEIKQQENRYTEIKDEIKKLESDEQIPPRTILPADPATPIPLEPLPQKPQIGTSQVSSDAAQGLGQGERRTGDIDRPPQEVLKRLLPRNTTQAHQMPGPNAQNINELSKEKSEKPLLDTPPLSTSTAQEERTANSSLANIKPADTSSRPGSQAIGQTVPWPTATGGNALPNTHPSQPAEPLNISSQPYPNTAQLPKPTVTPVTASNYTTTPPTIGNMGTTGNQGRPMPPVTDASTASQHPSKAPAPQTVQTVKFQPPWTPKTGPQSPYRHVSPSVNTPQSNVHIHNKQFPPRQQTVPTDKSSQSAKISAPPKILPQSQTDISTQPSTEGTLNAVPDGTAAEKLKTQFPSFATSLNRRPIRPSLDISGIQTPWKIPAPISVSDRPGSPARPGPEDISPISERETSPFGAPDLEVAKQRRSNRAAREKANEKAEINKPPAASTRSRNATPKLPKRETKTTPISRRNRSRGQSVTSPDDEIMPDAPAFAGRKIKTELPSTPIGIPDDGGQRARTPGRTKRKRATSESHAIAEDQQTTRSTREQYVICTRTFPRTCAPIMNDVAAHKHASIFAKPLTSRDAPGYRDLINRPQDIKSIKSAIHQGSRAVAAASEASTDVDLPGASAKNNGLMLKKTAELVPPKGIVNSSQLEKELIRMFANAVMFNPTPERTFGPCFPMRSDAASREGTHASELEEGGIINDTLEMYEDVEKAVSTWRAAERAVDDVGNKALKRVTPENANEDTVDH